MWKEKLTVFLAIPADFGVGNFPDAWSRPRDHTGQEGDTPLKAALIDKRQGALYALCSGVIAWAAARLETRTDTAALSELAIALFCLQQDTAYFRSPEDRPNLRQIDREERYAATVHYLQHKILEDRFRSQGLWPLYPNFSAVAQAINLTRHHPGPKQRAVFDPWIEGAIARMDVLAPFPEHADLAIDIPPAEQMAQRVATMGDAIPPQALDLSRDAASLDFPRCWRDFLTTVDWVGNRFLRPPDAVRLSSPKARPYQELG